MVFFGPYAGVGRSDEEEGRSYAGVAGGGSGEFISESTILSRCREEFGSLFRETGIIGTTPKGKECNEGHVWNGIMKGGLHNEIEEVVKGHLRYLYYIKCFDADKKEEVLRKGIEIEGKWMKLHSLQEKEVTVRILNCPFIVTDEELLSALRFYGETNRIEREEREMTTREGYTVLRKSGAKICVLKLKEGMEIKDIPNKILMKGTYPVTLKPQGKEDYCWRCRGGGHRPGACKSSLCEMCSTRGHVYSNCPVTTKVMVYFQGTMDNMVTMPTFSEINRLYYVMMEEKEDDEKKERERKEKEEREEREKKRREEEERRALEEENKKRKEEEKGMANEEELERKKREEERVSREEEERKRAVDKEEPRKKALENERKRKLEQNERLTDVMNRGVHKVSEEKKGGKRGKEEDIVDKTKRLHVHDPEEENLSQIDELCKVASGESSQDLFSGQETGSVGETKSGLQEEVMDVDSQMTAVDMGSPWEGVSVGQGNEKNDQGSEDGEDSTLSSKSRRNDKKGKGKNR